MDVSFNIKVLKCVFLIVLNKLICFRIYLIWTYLKQVFNHILFFGNKYSTIFYFSESSIQPYSIFRNQVFNHILFFRIKYSTIFYFSESSIQPYSIFPGEMFLLFTN